MLTPEKMLFVQILFLKKDGFSISRLLASEGTFHITEKQTGQAELEEAKSTRERCSSQAQLATSLLRHLKSRPLNLDRATIDTILSSATSKLLDDSQASLKQLQSEINSFFKKRKKLKDNIVELDLISEEMHLIDDCGIPFEDIADIQHFYMAWGLIGREEFQKLTTVIEPLEYGIMTRPRGHKSLSMLLLGNKEKSEEFKDALKQFGFKHHEVPEQFLGGESLEKIEMELWRLRENLAELNYGFTTNLKNWVEELSYWKTAFELHVLLHKSTNNFAPVGPAKIAAGFVPASQYKNLVAQLEKEAKDIYFAQAQKIEEVSDSSIQNTVPTKLKNWRIFRPFELFVKTYGLPRYKDIDPTPLVSISFLVMFGIMFADVGHGAILALFGACIAFLPYDLFSNLRSLGKILMMSGLSGVVFGFIFGSFFGIESDSVLPALWFRPSHKENLTLFLSVSLGIGIIIISIGIILNIIQNIRKGNLAKALFSQWGVASISFYWFMLLLFGLMGSGYGLKISSGLVAFILALPLVLVVAGQIVQHALSKHKNKKVEPLDPAIILIEPFEIITNLFSNSVSFLRVSAFGLAHAALSMSTFIIKDMIPFGGLDVTSLVFEHLFIIVLEGMIVTIQALRLEYYEFFSKFFEGGGVKYEPLSIKRN